MRTRFLTLAVALTALTTLTSGCRSQTGGGDALGDAVRVPGTQVKLVPAQGFTLATSFSGFESEGADKGTKASVAVTEFPGPFSQLLEAMSTEVLEQRGMKVLERKEVTASGYDAKLLTVINTIEGVDYDNRMLLVGNESKAVMVVAAQPGPISPDVEEQLLASLLSLEWDPDEQIDLFEGLGFRLPETDSVKAERRTPNGLLLRISGDRGDVVMFVSKVTPQIRIPELEPFSVARLKSMRELKELGELDGQAVEFGALKGWEIVGNAQHAKSGSPVVVYQMVLASDSMSFLIGGLVAAEGSEEYVDKFRATSRSLEPTS